MRVNVGRTSSAASAAIVCLLIAIVVCVSSIVAESEMAAAAAERRHTGRQLSPERPTARITADLPPPTAAVGQFSLLQLTQLGFNYLQLFVSLCLVRFFRNPTIFL